MKLHHVGYVISPSKLLNFQKKYTYIVDQKQKNYIFFEFSKKLNIWFEYLIPYSNESTVYYYYLKNRSRKKIHHFAFLLKNIKKTEKEMFNNGFILVGKYKINVPCFNGVIKTCFFIIKKI